MEKVVQNRQFLESYGFSRNKECIKIFLFHLLRPVREFSFASDGVVL